MPQFTATVLDHTGAPIWGKGFGDYIEADDAATARAQAEREFLAEIPDDPGADPHTAKFLASIRAKQMAAKATGFTVRVRRRA